MATFRLVTNRAVPTNRTAALHDNSSGSLTDCDVVYCGQIGEEHQAGIRVSQEMEERQSNFLVRSGKIRLTCAVSGTVARRSARSQAIGLQPARRSGVLLQGTYAHG